MKLPNPEKAVVDIRKLRDYCLSAEHRRGRHKARVFQAALGIRSEHAELLQAALQAAAVDGSVVQGLADGYGQRFVLDFQWTGPSGTATIRSNWIVLREDTFPRFVSCRIL
jgi:hypothetical protein